MIERIFPTWLEERLVSEEAFAAAYERVPEAERAWLKTCIARLFDWYGLQARRLDRRERRWNNGLFSLESREPLQWCLVRAFPADSSPSRLLAAVLPPVLAGVEALAAVSEAEGTAWTDGQLLALELAGVEDVYALSVEEGGRLDSELGDALSRGAVIEVGSEEPGPGRPGRPGMHRALPAPSVGVWAEGNDWDMQGLVFAQSGGGLQVWTPGPAPAAGPVESRTGTWEDFLACGFDAVFVPADRLREAHARVDRVFGPGQEGCWVWPELRQDDFSRYRVAWVDDEQE